MMVWDDGMIRKIESLPPLKTAIGRTAIPYIDHANNFKIYHQGGVEKVNDGFTQNFQVTDHLVAFQNSRALWVWDEGEKKLLSNYSEQYFVGDSVILYFDGVSKEFIAYYNGTLYPIEGFLAATNADLFNPNANVTNEMDIAAGQLPSVKVSNNIAAYINYSDQFKIFYHGEIINQDNYLIQSFDVGKNTVAYVDMNRQFKIFHKGQTQVLAEFPPESYSAGYDLVAFIDDNGNFKIFYNDSTYNIGYLQPNFKVRDNIVIYEDANGYFAAFYKGQIYTLDNRMPREWNAGYHSVAFMSSSMELKIFTDGSIYTVGSGILPKNWRLDYDVVQYQFGGNMYKIFYKGKTY